MEDKVMIEVTQKAADMIKEFMKSQKGHGTVRILLQICCGPGALCIALDEPKENDAIFTERGITFAINKTLLEKAKPIQIDLVEVSGKSEFQLTSSLPVDGGAGGCVEQW